MNARILLVAAAAVLAAAPLAAQGRCSAIPPERGERTDRRSAADSARDAQRDRVRDTLTARIRAGARAAGIAEPAALVVAERGDGRRRGVEISSFGGNVPDAVLRAVAADGAALLAGLPARENEIHLRLDPVSLPEGADSAGVVECQPDLADLDGLRRDLRLLTVREGSLPAGSNPRVVMHVRMLVTRDGEVAYARLSRRGFRPGLDAGVLALAREQRFLPATVGGVPVDVWVELPFHLELPVERRDPTRPRI